jgi:uncharacterized membrane protein
MITIHTAILTTICSSVVLVMFFYSLIYQGRTSDKYGNDERWQKIEEKSNTVMFQFFNVITIICGTATLLLTFWQKFNLTISLRIAFAAIMFIIVIGNFCKTMAMKYFDQNM